MKKPDLSDIMMTKKTDFYSQKLYLMLAI